MGRSSKKSAPVGQITLLGKVDDVIGADAAHGGRPLVIRGTRRNWKEVVRTRPGAAVVSVRDNVIRIQENADPIGFLMEVMNGSLFPVQYVDEDGNLAEHYVAAPMDARIQIAKYLANKVLPTLSVTKHVIDTPDPNDNQAYDPSRPGQPSFAQIVQMAAMRRKAGGVSMQVDDDPAYHDVEIIDGEGSGGAEDGGAESG